MYQLPRLEAHEASTSKAIVIPTPTPTHSTEPPFPPNLLMPTLVELGRGYVFWSPGTNSRGCPATLARDVHIGNWCGGRGGWGRQDGPRNLGTKKGSPAANCCGTPIRAYKCQCQGPPQARDRPQGHRHCRNGITPWAHGDKACDKAIARAGYNRNEEPDIPGDSGVLTHAPL